MRQVRQVLALQKGGKMCVEMMRCSRSIRTPIVPAESFHTAKVEHATQLSLVPTVLAPIHG